MGRWRDRLLGPDPYLEGEDPDPRFSLANERTFLAWNRTALALVTAGLAITQLLPPFAFPGARRLIGVPLIVLGIAISLLSMREWAANEVALRRGRALPRTRLTVLVGSVIGLVGAVALVLELGWGSS